MPEVILCFDDDLRGNHTHVFGPEPNLADRHCNGTIPDLTFNDQVSSLIVIAGEWRFYKDANFNAPYRDPHTGADVVLGPGSYKTADLTSHGIQNNDMSSLRPA